MAMYGIEFTIPTSHEFLSHSAESVQKGAESGIPNATGHERLAPFDPAKEVSNLSQHKMGVALVPV